MRPIKVFIVDDDRDFAESLEAGVLDLLYKPMDVEELMARPLALRSDIPSEERA